MIQENAAVANIATGIEAIRRRWPSLSSRSVEEPVFVLAASWRSGSTMLQRMLMPEAFIWGEPYGHAALIDSLANPTRAFTEQWPWKDVFYGGATFDEMSERFIANLYPDPSALLDAHLSFFDRLFAEPARKTGATRWGLKEVRLSADHAAYLRWLFPRAKFLFLHRNPWDAYQSYAARAKHGQQWFAKWPESPLTAETFGRHWRELASSFRDECERLGGKMIGYQDLAEGRIEEIEEYLGFKLCRKAMNVKPSDGGPPRLESIDERELDLLSAQVESVAASLGYAPPSAGPAISVREGTDIERSKCVVLVPTFGAIDPKCEAALNELAQRGYCVERARGYSQIDLGRSQMATDILRSGYEETLWIDSDVIFEPDDVERLRAHGLPLVCAIYPKKGPRAVSCHAMPGTKRITFGEQGGLVEILYAANGFLLVRRKVYFDIQHQLGLPYCNQRFGRPVVPFFLPLLNADGIGHWYLPEDYSFCERARRCGYKIWADTRIRLGHVGQYTYFWEDAGGTLPRYATYHFDLQDSE